MWILTLYGTLFAPQNQLLLVNLARGNNYLGTYLVSQKYVWGLIWLDGLTTMLNLIEDYL